MSEQEKTRVNQQSIERWGKRIQTYNHYAVRANLVLSLVLIPLAAWSAYLAYPDIFVVAPWLLVAMYALMGVMDSAESIITGGRNDAE